MANKKNKKDIKKNLIIVDFTKFYEALKESEEQDLELRAELIKQRRPLWRKFLDWFKKK